MIPNEMTVTQFTRVIVHTINVFLQMEHLHGTNLTKTVVKVSIFFCLKPMRTLIYPTGRVYKGLYCLCCLSKVYIKIKYYKVCKS